MIKCEVCGNSNIVKQEGVFICQSCGIIYSLEEIRKLLAAQQGSNNRLTERLESQGISLRQGDVVLFGNYPYYADDNDKYPISWIIAEEKDGRFLLLSMYLIDFIQYNTYDRPIQGVQPLLNSNGEYQYVWHNSSLRDWLNNKFYYEAFDDEERKGLCEKTLEFKEQEYSEDTEFGRMQLSAEALPDSIDKVFLPNSDEGFLIPFENGLPEDRFLKTPYAEKKDVNPISKLYCQFWNLTQPFHGTSNYANTCGIGSNDLIFGGEATNYAFLRPMILVEKSAIYNEINNYSDQYFSYYINRLKKHRKLCQEIKEDREKSRK